MECGSGEGVAPSAGCQAPKGLIIASGSLKPTTKSMGFASLVVMLAIVALLILFLISSHVVHTIVTKEYGHVLHWAYWLLDIFLVFGLVMLVGTTVIFA